MALAAAKVESIDVSAAKAVYCRGARLPHPKSSQHEVQDAAACAETMSGDVVVEDAELELEATVAIWSVWMQGWSRAWT
jgi:hypothetical protein